MESSRRDDDVLQEALDRWRRSEDPVRGSHYEHWSAPGGYWVRGGTLGAPAADFVVWIAAAVGSGVLGNAAYDGLKQMIVSFRRRRDLAAPLSSVQPQLLDDEARLIARLAVRVLRIESGLDDDGILEVVALAWSGDRGRWEAAVRDQYGIVRCSVSDADPTEVLVHGSRT